MSVSAVPFRIRSWSTQMRSQRRTAFEVVPSCAGHTSSAHLRTRVAFKWSESLMCSE